MKCIPLKQLNKKNSQKKFLTVLSCIVTLNISPAFSVLF